MHGPFIVCTRIVGVKILEHCLFPFAIVVLTICFDPSSEKYAASFPSGSRFWVSRASKYEMEHKRQYTFVTVVFGGDVELMNLQARSMDRYCPEWLVHEIILIDNFTTEKPKGWLERLKSDYGKLWSKVRIIEASKITPTKGVYGWWTQQALKLAVASHVKTDRYVLLDAKNHLVCPLTRDFLETSTGKTKINGRPYNDHPLHIHLVACCKYVGLDAASAEKWFVRTTTPFTIVTSEARSLVSSLETREKTNLVAALTRHNLTEFFIYAATLQKQGRFDQFYDWSQAMIADLWPEQGSNDWCVKGKIKTAQEDTSGPFLSIHRGALKVMTPVGKTALAEFWVSKGLFRRVEDANPLFAASK